MRILVTGGAGFIGSHLIDSLLANGHSVISIDGLHTGSADNIKDHFNLDKFWFRIDHKLDIKILESLVEASDVIYHLASIVGVSLVDEIKDAGMHRNLEMAQILFPLIEKYQKKLVFTSTSEVYGSRTSWCREDDFLTIGSPTKLRWSYACTKLMQEFMIHSYSFPFVIARLFNVTGPRQSWKYGMVIPRFIRATQEGTPLKVFGSGEQTRCFCHIKDCVSVLYEVGVYNKCDREIINIGTTEEISMKSLANKVIELSGKNNKIEYVPYIKEFSKQHADIMRRVPDVSKIQRLLSYEPKYNLSDIIKDML